MSKFDLLKAFIDQTYPPEQKFREEDVPDLTDKVVVITGGNTGIGKETARVVLQHGARVYIACRSEEKAQAAIKELKDVTGKTPIFFLLLDLSNLASVQKAAGELTNKESKVDVLFNNAGVMSPPIDQLTADGHDMTFGTNVLGPFLFTKLLLPLLAKASTEDAESPARVVFTSSLGHMAASKECIAWDTLKPGERGGPGDKRRRSLGPDVLYYQSKCATIMIAKEWARRYGPQKIVTTSLHPGTIKSELGRHWPAAQKLMMNMFIKLYPTAQGAITQLYAGTAPEGKDLNGKYLIPWARVGEPRKEVLDEEQNRRLWEYVEEQVSSYC